MATKMKYQEKGEPVDQLVCQLCGSYPKSEDQRWYKCSSQLHNICEFCGEFKKIWNTTNSLDALEKCSCQATMAKKVDETTTKEAFLKGNNLKCKCFHCFETFREGHSMHKSRFYHM